ncbi:MAG: hypothetical protein ABIP89_08930, partial [Polyangiaceae bacterium]
MKSLRPLLVLAIVTALPLALTACDLLKKKAADDAGAPAADTATPAVVDPAAAAAVSAAALTTVTPPANGQPGHVVPAVAKKLPDGGVVLVPAGDGGAGTVANPFAIPSTLPSNFPKTLPSGFPSALP